MSLPPVAAAALTPGIPGNIGREELIRFRR